MGEGKEKKKIARFSGQVRWGCVGGVWGGRAKVKGQGETDETISKGRMEKNMTKKNYSTTESAPRARTCFFDLPPSRSLGGFDEKGLAVKQTARTRAKAGTWLQFRGPRTTLAL